MTYIKALHHSSRVRTASCHHHFLLHMLGHSQASKLDTHEVNSVLLLTCLAGSLSGCTACSEHSLAQTILNTGWLCPDELQPPTVDTLLQLSERQSGQHILAQVMGSLLRSMKQSRIGSAKASSIKNVIHFAQ